MDENLLVRISVPTVDGKARLGTGYPVARDRILTARHVVTPGRDENQPIQILWPAAADVSGGATVGRIVWQGGPDLDAAILDTTFPTTVNTWGILSEQRPAPAARWNSCGFARAGKTPAERKLIGMIGHVLAVRESPAQLELGVEFPPEQREHWQGASGSPVFVQGRICGVVGACEENFRGNRLEATAVGRLLQLPEFRAAIGYDDRADLLAQVQRSIASRLERSPVALETLGRELKISNPSKNTAAWAADLAETLVHLQVEELIRKTNQAHAHLFDASSVPAVNDGGAIEEVASLLLPVVFDHAVVQSVRTSVSCGDAALVSLPAGTRSVAEIIMAGVDRGPVWFRTPVDEMEFMDGEFCLGVPPECGRNPAWSEFQQAWDDHLVEKFVSQEDRERSRHDHKTLVGLAADELEYLAEEYRRKHYFIFDRPQQEAERRSWEAVIRQLKKQYPAIVFISLSGDGEQIRRERKLLRPLRDLLRRSRKSGGKP